VVEKQPKIAVAIEEDGQEEQPEQAEEERKSANNEMVSFRMDNQPRLSMGGARGLQTTDNKNINLASAGN
jgi:hypothetical protein